MNFDYDVMPTRNKQTSFGVNMRKCECGCRTYLLYEENENYKVVCESCDLDYRFKSSSIDGAILQWNNLPRDFDGLLRCGKVAAAARLFAENYYRDGKMGYTRKLLIEELAYISDLYDKSVEDGFYLANENHERLLGKKPTLQCKYCIRINNATNNSPRKAYLYCPLCGRKRG